MRLHRLAPKWLSLATSITALLAITGCGVRGAYLSHTETIASAVGNPWRPRVREDGIAVVFHSIIIGYEGETIALRVINNPSHGCSGDRGILRDADAKRYMILGEAVRKANEHDTRWRDFGVFLPFSRLAKVDASTWIPMMGIVYAGNQGLATHGFCPRVNFPNEIWELVDYEEGVDLGARGRGHRLRYRLHIAEHDGRPLRLVLRIRDFQLTELTFPNDIEQTTIRCQFRSCLWDRLYAEFPYQDTPPYFKDRLVFVTPGLRSNDGSVRIGNVHMAMVAGASFDEFITRTEHKRDELGRQLRVLQEVSRALKEIKP